MGSTMKRIILLLLMLLLLCLTGCKKADPESAAPEPTTPATEVSQTAEDPEPIGYCGNTLTTIQVCEAFGQATGEEYTFMSGPSVTLTDLLLRLDYDPLKVCKCCDYDIAVTTEFGGPYYVSFREAYARCKNEEGTLAQADLTAEQLQTIQQILEEQREALD